jgi:hypothetical protein
MAAQRWNSKLVAAAPWAAAAVVAGLAIASRDADGHHPTPREGVHAGHVVDAARYAGHSRVEAAYRKAAEIPQVLDGLYCHCDCSQHSGHYSLLDCFRDDHAARCDVCMSEAELAHRMTQEGKSLDEIRTAIDAFYST